MRCGIPCGFALVVCLRQDLSIGGEDKGAHRDALLMGTSLVLEVQGEAEDALDGVRQAAAAIDDGRAERFLEKMAEHFQRR